MGLAQACSLLSPVSSWQLVLRWIEAVLGFPCCLEQRPSFNSSLTPGRNNDLHLHEPVQPSTMAHKICSVFYNLIAAAATALLMQCLLWSRSIPRDGALCQQAPSWFPGAGKTWLQPPELLPPAWHTSFEPMVLQPTEALVKSTKLLECPGKWEWAGLTQGWFETSLVAF